MANEKPASAAHAEPSCPTCLLAAESVPGAKCVFHAAEAHAERLARDEDRAGGTVSVGGLVTRLDDDPPPQCKLCGIEGGKHLAECPRSPEAHAELPPPLADRTLKELDRLSIRTGYETEINRQADLELHRRGYAFDATQARWVKVATDYDAMKVEQPELLAQAEAELATSEAHAEPLTDQRPDFVKMVACPHHNRTGGNDYIECWDCGLMWDYRRETDDRALIRLLLAAHATQQAALRELEHTIRKTADSPVRLLTGQPEFDRGYNAGMKDAARAAADRLARLLAEPGATR